MKHQDNPIAAAVKLADLADNSNPDRLDPLTEEDLARNEKYREAQRILTEQQGALFGNAL